MHVMDIGGTSARRTHAWWALPYFIVLLLAFVVPFAGIVMYSISENGVAPTAAQYLRLWRQPVYAHVFLNTAAIASLVMIACMLLGFPLALLLARLRGRWQQTVLALVLVPFWTSILVRTYAWLVLLQQQGAVNRLLLELRLVDRPLTLVHNFTGVVIGMTYVLLPFMVLSIFTALRAIDPWLTSAAATLGASRGIIFWRVLVPLSCPGLMAGAFLVFVLSLGYFITPALLGGLGQTTAGIVIEVQMNRILDWSFGSALAVTLTGIILGAGILAVRGLDPRLLTGKER